MQLLLTLLSPILLTTCWRIQKYGGFLVDKEKTGSVRANRNAPTVAPPVTLVFGWNPAYKYGQV
jgi:hypothetical protein